MIPPFTATTPDAALAHRGEPARRALLLAGAQVFGEKGLDGATTRDIAALAGQNIASIKYYFESKEGLYHAIAGEIGAEIGRRMGRFSQHLATVPVPPTPREALDLLKQFVATMAQTMTGGDLVAIPQFIIREQQNPTRAFDLLYDGGMRGVHETFVTLIAIAFDRPPRAEDTVLRAHALMGQILGFRVARATLLRRTGWTDVGPTQTRAIVEAINAGLDLMFAGRPDAGPRVRSRARRAPSSTPKDTNR